MAVIGLPLYFESVLAGIGGWPGMPVPSQKVGAPGLCWVAHEIRVTRPTMDLHDSFAGTPLGVPLPCIKSQSSLFSATC